MFLDFGAVWSHVSSFVTSQLRARGEKSIKSMELGEASARLCVRIDVTAAHVTIQRLGGEGIYQVRWAFTYALSLPPVKLAASLSSLRNLLTTLRPRSVSTVPHGSSLPPHQSSSAYILHLTTSHPETPPRPPSPLKMSDIGFNTDQMRQCVSSITSHGEQWEQVKLFASVC